METDWVAPGITSALEFLAPEPFPNKTIDAVGKELP
jgi:hypothetical protein